MLLRLGGIGISFREKAIFTYIILENRLKFHITLYPCMLLLPN
jgi:hypothetical protein